MPSNQLPVAEAPAETRKRRSLLYLAMLRPRSDPMLLLRMPSLLWARPMLAL